ncbi:exosporium morphogenetic protein CdeC [Terrisporobacter sp.]
MHDLKRSKRKMYNKQMPAMNNDFQEESTVEIDELDRGCKNKNNYLDDNNDNGCCNSSQNQSISNQQKHNHDNYEYECICECKKTSHEDCDPCEANYDSCVVNPCTKDECGNGIRPTYSTRNASPVAIEADRIYDAIQFQVFTDATGPNGEPLYFDYEVADINGSLPTVGSANVVVDEVCMNYSSLEIIPGVPTLEDFEIEDIEDNTLCDTAFEYAVCPERNATCAARNRGQSVSYKERGLTVVANDLVLELRAHCGRTKIVAYAYPAVRNMGGKLCRVDSVEFRFNTLSGRMSVPSSGRPFKLRQNFRTNLTVDCISKAYISMQDYCGCDCDNGFELTIPSGIDLICCIEETVSILINDQLVVLAVSDGLNPRVVDTFANVCSFQNSEE